MEAKQEEKQISSTWEKSEQSIERILSSVDLYSNLPNTSGERTVAILGAGQAVEVIPLSDLFFNKEQKIPNIIAFDLDHTQKTLTEQFLQDRTVRLEYRIADIKDEKSYGDEQYDLIIIRNPDVHSTFEGWKLTLGNAFNHLKVGGVLFLTVAEPHVRKFAGEELGKRKCIIKEYDIPSKWRSAYVSEDHAFIVKKA